MNIEKKEIKAQVIELLSEGYSKQETYNTLASEYGNSKVIANMIRFVPDPVMESKFRLLNIFVIILLSALIILQLFSPNISILTSIILLYIVVSRKYNYFISFLILGVGTILTDLIFTFYNVSSFEFSPFTHVLIISLSCFFIFYGYYMPKKVTPEYDEVKEIYINENGQECLALKYKFK